MNEELLIASSVWFALFGLPIMIGTEFLILKELEKKKKGNFKRKIYVFSLLILYIIYFGSLILSEPTFTSLSFSTFILFLIGLLFFIRILLTFF